MSEIDDGLGRRLREMRRAKGWTQMELSERSGVSQKDISAYERGKNANIRVNTLRRLADALYASMDYLLGR